MLCGESKVNVVCVGGGSKVNVVCAGWEVGAK